MIRGVIFDLGNTLMHFEGEWDGVAEQGMAAMDQFLTDNGYSLEGAFEGAFLGRRKQGRDRSARTDVEYTASQALRDTLTYFGHSSVPPGVIARALELFFQPEVEHWVAYDDAQSALEQLAASGYKLGIISNATDDAFVQRITERAGFRAYFNPVVSSAAMPWRKPDPRINQHVLKVWGLSPEEAVMVGDWPSTDVLGAHRAGMPAILVDERWPEPPHLHADVPDKPLLTPDAVIRQLLELAPAIAGLSHPNSS